MNVCNKCGRKSFATPPCPDCGSDDYRNPNDKLFKVTLILMFVLFLMIFAFVIFQPSKARNLPPSGKDKVSNQLIYT